MEDRSRVGLVAHRFRTDQAGTACCGLVHGVRAEHPARRDFKGQANALFCRSNGGRGLIGQQFALALLVHFGDFAGAHFWQVQGHLFDGFQLVPVFIGAHQNIGTTDHEFVAFTAHFFDQNSELQLATAEDVELVCHFGVFETKGNVAADFVEQALAQFTGLNGLAFTSRIGGRVDGENHAHGGLFNRDPRESLAIQTTEGVTDFQNLAACDQANVTGDQLVDFHLLHPLVGQQPENREFLDGRFAVFIDAVAQDFLPFPNCACFDAAQGQVTEVFGISDVGNEHL